ncbi:MAG: sulfotransferase [Fimbriimonas sp.]
MSKAIADLFADALKAYERGDLQLADSLAGSVVEAEPEHVEGLVLVGLVCARTKRKAEAISALQRALELDPSSFEAHVALSTLLFSEGRLDEATHHGEAAIEIMPSEVDPYRNLSANLIKHRRHEQAARVLVRALALVPDDPSLNQDLAAVLSDLGQFAEARKIWQHVLSLQPGLLAGWLKLGGINLAASDFESAVVCGKRAVDLAPNSADARILLGLSLAERGRPQEAESHLRVAAKLQPQEYIAHSALGLSMQEQGRFDEARVHLERSVRLNKTNGQAYYALARGRRITEADSQFLSVVEKAIADPASSVLDRSYMHYTLAKAWEDLGHYEEAMKAYDAATELAAQFWFGDRAPSFDWYRSMIDGTIKTFTAEKLDHLAKRGISSEKPLIVVRMIRSGTTLVEQILSSHPQVTGGGELTFWHERAAEVFDPLSCRVHEDGLARVGAEYLKLLEGIDPDAARVTDKLPHNYVMLGLILAAFPNARVIHVSRNPLDNCLSIYTTAYNRAPEFTLRRASIVFSYREYQRMMEHWRKVLPQDRLLEVTYEDLIADREENTRRMVEFAGLTWDEACLHHEQNTRNVNTPSVWQVRQPIYSTSVERWRRFEPWLGEFGALLQKDA